KLAALRLNSYKLNVIRHRKCQMNQYCRKRRFKPDSHRAKQYTKGNAGQHFPFSVYSMQQNIQCHIYSNSGSGAETFDAEKEEKSPEPDLICCDKGDPHSEIQAQESAFQYCRINVHNIFP